MTNFTTWFSRIALSMAGKSPWGNGGSNGDDNGNDGGDSASTGPRNPWQPGNRPAGTRTGSNIEDLFKRGRGRGPGGGAGGGGGFTGLPRRPNGKSYVPLIIGAVVLLWLVLTSFHRIAANEQGVVTFFGSYSRIMSPGVHMSLPWPLEKVQSLDVQEIRTEDIPKNEGEKLILTGDQNLVDLAYSVRWNIKDLKLYLFQLAEPDETIREVGEAAMRASVAEITLDDAIGSGRNELEQRVALRMQELLDQYKAGVTIQGVAIKKADPPAEVNDAFKAVSASQQEAQTYLNEARAYAQQLTAQAQGEAAAFDKVYAEYRLAPRVTRQRMYYETMERVLAETDKTVVETGNVTPYLPLPEIRRKQKEPDVEIATEPAQ